MVKRDVIVIGGGITGTAVLRQLAKYQLDVLLLEAKTDIAAGVTKGNGGVVHSGYDAKNGTLKAKLNVKGCAMYEELSKQLGFDYHRKGTLTISFDDREGLTKLKELYENGKKNGVPDLKIIGYEEIKAIEPHVSPKAKFALYAPTAAIVDPYEVALAFAENAIENGAQVRLRQTVKKVERDGEDYIIKTQNCTYRAKYVVNCAGIHGDTVAKMAGINDYTIKPRHGALMILDRSIGFELNTVLFPVPGRHTKGMAAIPTCSGNILLGSTATMMEDKEYHGFTREDADLLFNSASKLVPELDKKYIIRIFSGLRPVEINSNNDFVIEESRNARGFINCIGIQSPGIASAPAIAEYVVDILKNAGCKLNRKKDFKKTRKPFVHFNKLSAEEKNKIIKNKPEYANIICRCEFVTEGEILDAIHRPLGATTVDGIKRRTRAGMGRCQGGFCQPRILEILARELNVRQEDLLLEEEGSYILLGKE